ncbi:MAG TPA: hypothetical protein PLQ81_09645, partial [bacterium]|nr:hypothetical protein [bacterium]
MKNAADKKRIILDLIMKNKLICFSAVVAFFICIMIPSELSAFGSKDVGTTGAAFLKLGYGARPAGMGEAFSAVSGDINSLYYNPAGLYDVSNKTISFMHLNWLLDINYNVLS